MADITGSTLTADKWLPEVWSELATTTYRSNVVLVPLFDHSWEKEIQGGPGDTVNIPAFTQNSAANSRATFGTGAAVTFDAVTESQVALVINTMVYKAYRYPIELEPQFLRSYVGKLTDGIGTACALLVDANLAGDNSNGIDAFTTVVGTDNIDITDANILTIEANLDGQNAPDEDRFLVVSPASRVSMLGIDRLVNQLYRPHIGSLAPQAGRGYLGDVYKFHVYQSNNLEAGSAGKKNGGFQREAIAFAEQKSLTMLKDLNMEDGVFVQVLGCLTYGAKMVKTAYGNELDGK